MERARRILPWHCTDRLAAGVTSTGSGIVPTRILRPIYGSKSFGVNNIMTCCVPRQSKTSPKSLICHYKDPW